MNRFTQPTKQNVSWKRMKGMKETTRKLGWGEKGQSWVGRWESKSGGDEDGRPLYRARLKGSGQVWWIWGGKIAFSCLLHPFLLIFTRDDSHCLCFPGNVVEDVVHSGQKMAEEALFPVKWNLHLWSQLVLPLLSAFALKYAHIFFNRVLFFQNIWALGQFRSQTCGFTQPKGNIFTYPNTNSDNGSHIWNIDN